MRDQRIGTPVDLGGVDLAGTVATCAGRCRRMAENEFDVRMRARLEGGRDVHQVRLCLLNGDDDGELRRRIHSLPRTMRSARLHMR